jgi:hypothetical protein
VRPTAGFDSTQARRTLQQQRYAEVSAPVEEPAAEPTPSNDAVKAARCKAIDAEIEQIDAAARAGGTATYQDWLRERRHKLVDEKYRLKC